MNEDAFVTRSCIERTPDNTVPHESSLQADGPLCSTMNDQCAVKHDNVDGSTHTPGMLVTNPHSKGMLII